MWKLDSHKFLFREALLSYIETDREKLQGKSVHLPNFILYKYLVGKI